MRGCTLTALVLLALLAPAPAEEGSKPIGSVRVRAEELVLAVGEGVTFTYPRTEESLTLGREAWSRFVSLFEKACERVSELPPGAAEYVGNVGDLHVTTMYEERGRNRGPRVVVYVVAPGGRNSNIYLDQRGRQELERLIPEVDKALTGTP